VLQPHGLKQGQNAPPENLEQAARKARYAFLQRTADKKHSHFVLTATRSTIRPRTILMRLLRGSAAEGFERNAPRPGT